MIVSESAELDNLDVGVSPPHPPALALSDWVYLFNCGATCSFIFMFMGTVGTVEGPIRVFCGPERPLNSAPHLLHFIGSLDGGGWWLT